MDTEQAITRPEIVRKIREERQALMETVDSLDEEQVLAPELDEGWSVKDVLAHVTTWEKMMIRWVEESLRGEVPDRPRPGESWDDLDELNAELYEKHKDRPLDDVMEEFRRSGAQVRATVDRLTDADLLVADRFAWRNGVALWHMVAANTFWHYKEHRQTIEEQFEQE